MPLVNCGSIDLSAALPLAVDLSKFSAIGANPCEVRIANESPLTLQVQIGPDEHTLPAWVVDKFPLCGNRSFKIVPSQIQSPTPGGVPSNVALLTVAPAGDTIPGTYPAPLPRLTSVHSPQLSLTNLTFPNTGATTQTTDAVPAGTHALAFSGDATSGLASVTVKGHTSGTQYFPKDTNIFPAAGVKLFHAAFVIVPVDSVHDSQYDVTGTNGTGAAIVLRVAAILDTQAVEVTNSGADPIFIADATGEGWNPISVAQAAASPDFRPTSPPVVTSLAVIGTAVMVAAVAGQTVRCFGGMIAVEVAGATTRISVEDSAANVRQSFEGNAVGNTPFQMDGAPIGAVGTGVTLRVANVIATIRASLAFSQA